MFLTPLLPILSACRPAAPAAPAGEVTTVSPSAATGSDTGSDTGPASPTSPTAATTDTGAAGSGTGATGDTAAPDPGHPATTILTGSGDDLWVSAWVVRRSEGPDAVGIGDYGADRVYLLSGALPAGTHAVTDVWDGHSELPITDAVVSTGDLDGDGYDDAWVGCELHRGPLPTLHPPLAVLPGDGYCSRFGAPVVSDVDLNGDGHVDLVLQDGSYDRPTVLFGPLDGVAQPPATVGPRPSKLVVELRVFPDAFGPGEAAIGVMNILGYRGDAPYELYAPEPMVPGGDYSEPSLSITPSWWTTQLEPAGDLDGDGLADTISDGDRVVSGPLPRLSDGVEVSDLPGLDIVDGVVAAVVPDLVGDGIDELLIQQADGSLHLLLSPHPGPGVGVIDGTAGLKLALGDRWSSPDFLDLDGDGVDDLVVIRYGDSSGDEPTVHVFDGAELLSAALTP